MSSGCSRWDKPPQAISCDFPRLKGRDRHDHQDDTQWAAAAAAEVASVMSDSVRPHGQQPARLLCPQNSLGKNTGVGCHFLLPRCSAGEEYFSEREKERKKEKKKIVTRLKGE